MDLDTIVTLAREGVNLVLLVSAPILLIGGGVSVVIGIFQTITQIQDQAVLFVVRFIAILLAFSFTLPWTVEKVVEYSQCWFNNISEIVTLCLP